MERTRYILRLLRLLTPLLRLPQCSKDLDQKTWAMSPLCVFPICLVSIVLMHGLKEFGPVANLHMQPRVFGKQSTATASAGPATTKPSTTLTPDKSTFVDISPSVLQAQENIDSIISPTLPVGSDVGVRGEKSSMFANGAPHRLDIASADLNVTSRQSTVPEEPQPADEPEAIETTTPVKRAPEDTLTPPPDVKRIKTDEPLSVSPQPRLPSLEMRLAEKRKQLETTRKSRADIAKKMSHIKDRLAPYKQRIAEELERLSVEQAEESAMLAKEEEEYKARQKLLAEYEGGDSDFYRLIQGLRRQYEDDNNQ